MFNIQIREVKTKKDLQKFVDFQFSLYSGNKFFVPGLRGNIVQTFNSEKNPSFEFCNVRLWLALQQNKVVGRIAGIINTNYNILKNERYIRFGWLDFIDNKMVLEELINTVIDWGKYSGLEKIHGPLGMTNFDPSGLLVDGFDEIASFGSSYNYPYYGRYLEELGFVKENDWIEFKIPVPSKTPEQITRIARLVSEKYKLIIVRPKTRKELLKYGKGIFRVINEAYKNLYSAMEFTEKQIDYYIHKYLHSLHPRYTSIVLINDEVIAFGISMPSISKALQKSKGRLFPFGFVHLLKAMHRNHVIELMLIAVKPELQNKGINSIMFDELIPKYIEDGIEYVETNSEMETNLKVQLQWKYFEPKLTKRKRSYARFL